MSNASQRKDKGSNSSGHGAPSAWADSRTMIHATSKAATKA